MIPRSKTIVRLEITAGNNPKEHLYVTNVFDDLAVKIFNFSLTSEKELNSVNVVMKIRFINVKLFVIWEVLFFGVAPVNKGLKNSPVCKILYHFSENQSIS